MDLALELGCTVEELGHRMAEHELGQWVRYAARKRLPMRRIEHYLAQIAAMLSSGKHSVSDFLLFKPVPVVVDEPTKGEDAARAVSLMAGGAKVIDLREVRRPDGY